MLSAWRHNMPLRAQAPRAPTSRRSVAVLCHDEYVPTLTAAAALHVKAALTFELLTLKVVSKSRVMWAISVPILVFYSSLFSTYARCSRQTDRRKTDVRQKHRLMAPPIRGRGVTNRLIHSHTELYRLVQKTAILFVLVYYTPAEEALSDEARLTAGVLSV